MSKRKVHLANVGRSWHTESWTSDYDTGARTRDGHVPRSVTFSSGTTSTSYQSPTPDVAWPVCGAPEYRFGSPAEGPVTCKNCLRTKAYAEWRAKQLRKLGIQEAA